MHTPPNASAAPDQQPILKVKLTVRTAKSRNAYDTEVTVFRLGNFKEVGARQRVWGTKKLADFVAQFESDYGYTDTQIVYLAGKSGAELPEAEPLTHKVPKGLDHQPRQGKVKDIVLMELADGTTIELEDFAGI